MLTLELIRKLLLVIVVCTCLNSVLMAPMALILSISFNFKSSIVNRLGLYFGQLK